MPIALFPELAAALLRLGRALAPWERLTGIEIQLLRRARSAFLTSWFGPNIPEQRLSLHVTIRNLGALRKRYLLAQRSMAPPVPELSLLGPLSGIAGLLVGMAMSPTGLVLVASQIDRIAGLLVEQPLKIMLLGFTVLGLYLVPGVAPAAALLFGLPALLAGALGAAAGGNRTVRSLVTLLGDLALLLDALRTFWDQVSGPRGAVRNSLLRRILDTLDRFAALFAQVLGLAGILLVRLAPLIPNLLDQYRALRGLLDAAMAALGDILGGMIEALLKPFTEGSGLLGVLGRVLDILFGIPEQVLRSIRETVADATLELGFAFDAISKQVSGFIDGFVGRLTAAFEATALGQLVARIKALMALMTTFIQALRNAPPPSKEEKGETLQEILRSKKVEYTTGGIIGPGVGSRIADVLDAIEAIKLPKLPTVSVPPLPAAPKLPDIDALLKARPGPAVPDIGAMATELIEGAQEAAARAPVPAELLRSPKSAFAGERRRLEAATPGPVLALDDQRLRDLIYIAVGRVLPPALRIYAPDVRALLDRIDEEVYALRMTAEQRAARAAELLPVQDLGDNGRLLPVIGTLRFLAPGGEAPDLRAFRDLVRERIEGQSYLAPAAP